MKTGAVTSSSLERLERSAAHGLTIAVCPASAAASTGASEGSRRSGGIVAASPVTSPDFASPCGISAVRRSVQPSNVTTAPHGTPATSEFMTAPPP